MIDVQFASTIKEKLSNKYAIANRIGEYPHPHFSINSLSEYLEIISSITKSVEDQMFYEKLIFRGMSDTKFLPIPSLARIPDYETDIEQQMITEFLARRPDEFAGLSAFDIIAKMQHYNLPTRLLDFTINPLIALYFACSSHKESDGRVLCHCTYLQSDRSEYANAICKAAIEKSFDGNYSVEQYYCDDKLSFNNYMDETYFYEETTVIRPKYWNQRIANQGGLFMVFPNNLRDNYKNVLVHIDEMGIDKAIREFARGSYNRTLFEEGYKREPLSLYRKEPYYLTEKCYQKITKAYSSYSQKERLEKFSQRFLVDDSIKLLSRDKLKKSFCSIIVKHKEKDTILKDLSSIGYGVDFIFPELEYTAKEIRRVYGAD